MKQYKLKNPAKLGDYDPKYGQRWWADTYDQAEPVMFNLMSENELHDGETVTAETVELATSAKGTEYHKLKKVKPDTQQTITVSTKDYTPKKEYKDNSDGQRQGMCINNAAHYISEHTSGILTAKEWALKVHDFATALYVLGDLSGSQGDTTSQTETKADKTEPATVQEDNVVMDIGDEPINLDDIPF